MKRNFLLGVIMLCLSAVPAVARPAAETISFGPFGRVVLYRGVQQPAGLVLFLSGDGGWNRGVDDMARELAGLRFAVAGVDVPRYLRKLEKAGGVCSYPAADFEALSKYIQKKLGFARYRTPVLAGYSSGAALVYAVLAQSPPDTFRGGLGMGFCPSLGLRKPLCRGRGLEATRDTAGKGIRFLPGPLSASWTVLQGAVDRVCPVDEAVSFVRKVPEARIKVLPKVGHGFSVRRNWLPAFEQAVEQLKTRGEPPAPADDDLAGLPLVEVPAAEGRSGLLAVIISGDGGWAGLDREVGSALARQGIPVAGLNSLQYFWTKRTPETASGDLARILRHYLGAWRRKDALLIGYSLGAEVLPFMANRLPADLLGRVREIVLLSPGKRTEFEFHLSEWLTDRDGSASKPVLPEVEKLRGKKIVCIYGSGEKDSLCPDLGPDLAESIRLSGGHHLGGQYDVMARMILERAGDRQGALRLQRR